MANEIFKELKTRIALKYLPYETWSVESFKSEKPLKGEVWFCDIPSNNTEATTAPTVLFKVGDGVNNFGALKWASALAADVYEWAKRSGVKVEGSGNAVTNAVVKTAADGKQYLTFEKGTTFATKAELDAAIEAFGGDLSAITDNDHQYSFVVTDGKLVVTAVNYVNGKAGESATVATLDFVTPSELEKVLEGYITVVQKGGENGDVFDITTEDTVVTLDMKFNNEGGNVKFSSAAAGLTANVDLTHNHDDEYKKLQNKVNNATSKTKIITSLTQNEQGVIAYTAENLTHESVTDVDTAVKAVTVDNAVEADHVAHKLSINGQEYDGSEKVDVTIDASTLGLESAMHFVGALSEAPETAKAGDVYLNTATKKEYVYADGQGWVELGDEGSHALKSVKVEGTGYLTGGGDLTKDRTIDIADAVKTKIDHGATAYSWGNHASAGYAKDEDLTKVINGTTVVAKAANADEAAHAGRATSADDSTKLGGKLPSEYATSAQGAKADSAVQSVSIGVVDPIAAPAIALTVDGTQTNIEFATESGLKVVGDNEATDTGKVNKLTFGIDTDVVFVLNCNW